MDLVITTKQFLEEYCILIRKFINGYFYAVLLWLRLLAKCLVTECNLKIRKTDSCILFSKDTKGKLELMMPVHVDDLFMAGKLEKSKNIKEKIK